MKILRLDLLAFGCFTGATLDLSAGQHGLHVVYGPNEAGKSTALRALENLLYGFKVSTTDAQVHAYGDLRVGALLQAHDGRRLECIRRKGNKNTLRGPDDAAVLDGRVLDTLLGHIDRESFLHRFGISHAELVAGGQAMVSGGGDVGQSLFAAAAGTANLARVRKDFATAAGELFKPSGVNPRINQALRAWKEQQQRVKEAQIRVADWEARAAACAEAEAVLEQIEGRLRAHEAEKRRADLFLQALPEIALRRDLLRALEPLAKLPRLAASFAERQLAAQNHLDRAEVLERVAQGDLDRNAAALARLGPEGLLLGQRKEIEQLTKALGSIEKALDDRPRLQERQRVLDGECQRLWQQLDPQLSAERIEQALKAADRARLNKLAAEHPRRAADWAAAVKARATLQGEIEHLEQRLAALPAPPDGRALRAALRSAEKLVDGDQVHEDMPRRQQQARKLQQALAQLGWEKSSDELAQAALPARETIDRCRAESERSASTLAALEQERERIDRERREYERRAEELRLTQDVPTEDDVAAARQLRDDGWRLVLAAWRKELPARSAQERFIAAFPPATELAQAYELAVRRADELADRLRRETAQVTLKCELQTKLAALAEEQVRLRDRTAAAQDERTALTAAWQELWRPLGVTPRSPAEMRAWRDQAEEAVALSEALAEQAVAVAAQKERLAQVQQQLAVQMAAVQAAPFAEMSLAALVELAAERVRELDAQSLAREALVRDVHVGREKLPALVAAEQQAEGALGRWRSEWAAALAPLALTAQASPAEAQAVLELIDAIQEKQRESAGLGERIAGIDRDQSAFAERVGALAQAVAPDLASLPAAAATETLAQRLVTEAKTAAQREEVLQALRLAEEKLRAEGEKRMLASRELQSLCREAQCENAAALPGAAEQAARRQALEAKLAETEDRLRRCAAGEPLEHFTAQAAAMNDAELNATLARATAAQRELAAERDAARDRLRDARAELAKIDGGAAAAEAQAAAERIAADVGTGVEEYARLQLAGAVLARAVERYRQKNQGELLQRASDLFQELTLGSFQGLRADFSEAGKPVLVGLRGDYKQLGVEAMSEGTRDQLYLALRLASVEMYCRTPGVEPLPFIVDDVLIHFDDDRSAAALRALARLSEHTQVVFFTHHEHLLEIAGGTLDHDVLFVQRLQGQGGGPAVAAAAERLGQA